MNEQTKNKVYTKIEVEQKLGKDGKTYKNVKLYFLTADGKELFSLVVNPAFKLTPAQYGLYQALLERC